MKNFIIGLCSILILILTGLTVGTVHGKTMRENELSSTVSSTMEESMRILTLDQKYKIENEKEFIADFIESSLVKMDSNSIYEIIIHTVDIKKGILDATVKQHYKQIFIPGKVSCRKTIILDDYNKEGSYKITFKKGDKIIKQLSVTGGDFMSAALLPNNVEVTKWKLQENGNIYTSANIANVAVTQDLTFIAQLATP